LARHGEVAWQRRGACAGNNGHDGARIGNCNRNVRAFGHPNRDRSCGRHRNVYRDGNRDPDGDTDGDTDRNADSNSH